MTIIIHELVIKSKVGKDSRGEPQPSERRKPLALEKKEIIQECVEEVLKIIEQKEER